MMSLALPQRIVCLTEETTEWLYLLGEEARIVGISGYTVRPRRAREEKPKVSAFLSAKIDKILTLQPDCVFGFSDLQADIAALLIRAGVLPEKAVRDYKDRLFDLHIKDVTIAAEEGKAIEIGRGVINFPELIKSLKKIQYKGICSIEFEKDMGDPLPGIAESTGYFKAVLAAG